MCQSTQDWLRSNMRLTGLYEQRVISTLGSKHPACSRQGYDYKQAVRRARLYLVLAY